MIFDAVGGFCGPDPLLLDVAGCGGALMAFPGVLEPFKSLGVAFEHELFDHKVSAEEVGLDMCSARVSDLVLCWLGGERA